MTPSNWTDERIEQLRSMYAAGISFAGISSVIGMSRNACIGKAHRLDLPRPEKKQPPHRELKPKAERRPYFKVVASGNFHHRVIETVTSNAPAAERDLTSLNKTIEDLRHDDCRFIAGDPLTDGPGLYCGHPIHKGSYCAEHSARCYYEPLPRLRTTPRYRSAA